MYPAYPCTICQDPDHKTKECPTLSSETRHPNAPEPTGPRGQDEEDRI